MSVDSTVLEAINERLRREKQELAAENAALRQRLADQERQWSEKLVALETQLKKALERIQELERKSARQAAPFRRDSQKKKGNGKPGRKAGFRGTQRQRPPQIDHDIEVPLEIKICPDCVCRLDRQPLTG
jgi:hypothetical protein